MVLEWLVSGERQGMRYPVAKDCRGMHAAAAGGDS